MGCRRGFRFARRRPIRCARWSRAVGKEVEHKYLLKSDEWRKHATRGVLYRQGYLSIDPKRSVRVRVAGGKAFVTIKGEAKGAVRDEFEYPIPVKDGEQLLRTLCLKPLITKTR